MTPTRQRTCSNGHHYVKSSDCPVCPVCARESKQSASLFAKLSAPARRALENNKIGSVEDLAMYTEAEILSLHGMGPASLPILRNALKTAGLAFRGR